MTFMKRIVLLFVCCSLAFSAWAQFEYIEAQEQKEEVAEQTKRFQCGQNRQPVRVSTFTTNPPFGWTERKLTMQHYDYFAKGYNVDFLKEIMDELNIYTRFVGYKTDEEMLQAFVRGDLDIIVGMYYDTANYGRIASTVVPSFMQNFITVIFMKGKEKDVKTFADLAGLKGVVRQDEHFYDYVYKMMPKDANMVQVPNSREAFTKLLTGEVDYMLASPYSAEAEARRFKMNLEISMIPVPLLGQELFVMYSKASQCPQYGRMIAKKIHEKRQDMPGMQRKLVSYIDSWGQRFKDTPSLREQLGLTQQDVAKENTPESLLEEQPKTDTVEQPVAMP